MARTPNDQIHWLIWNIPPTTVSLPENVPEGPNLPDGSHQISASGRVYRPVGATTNPVHHYTIEVYALDTTIDVQASNDAQETRARVFQAMSGHVIGKGFLPGRSALPAPAK